jgi:D-sedoheptulose 7-phosphate isomerase
VVNLLFAFCTSYQHTRLFENVATERQHWHIDQQTYHFYFDSSKGRSCKKPSPAGAVKVKKHKFNPMTEFIRSRIRASADLKNSLLQNTKILETVSTVVEQVIECYKTKGKVLWCGNGGSAADSQHLAAELSGRFYYDRPPLFSEALHVNTSYITAVANDYSYDVIYSRLVEAMGSKGDILIGMSTSGNSANVVKALEAANKKGMLTVGFTGESGGKMKELCKYLINIPSEDTPRIQECHMLLGHTICELVETRLFPRDKK